VALCWLVSRLRRRRQRRISRPRRGRSWLIVFAISYNALASLYLVLYCTYDVAGNICQSLRREGRTATCSSTRAPTASSSRGRSGASGSAPRPRPSARRPWTPSHSMAGPRESHVFIQSQVMVCFPVTDSSYGSFPYNTLSIVNSVMIALPSPLPTLCGFSLRIGPSALAPLHTSRVTPLYPYTLSCTVPVTTHGISLV